jgi:hypothetical protein
MSIRVSIRRCLMFGWIVAGLQVFATGQDQPSQNPPSQTPSTQSSGDNSVRTAPATALSAIGGMQIWGGDEEDTSHDLPHIPALLGGRGTTMAFLSELERMNYIRAGLNVSTTYDDNPLLASTGAVGDASVSIFPSIRIEESTTRLRWTLGYAGGWTVNQKLTNENQASQTIKFDSEYRPAPHVSLRVAETFALTTGLFDAGNGTEVAGGTGPNLSLITPLATQRSSVTTVELNYHVALNDLVGTSGSFYDLHYTNIPAGTEYLLTDTQTATGSAFWLHRIFRGDWGGFSYRFERITSNPGGDETRVNSFLAADTASFSKHFTLSGFIGPQYSENVGLAPGGGSQLTQSNNWSVTGGAEGGWRNDRTSAFAGFSRSISDGGGVLGAVRLQTVNANFRRELVPGWAATLTAGYGTNQSITLAAPGSASSINSTTAGILLERNVGKSVGFRFGYIHDFQQQFGLTAAGTTLDASRNRVFMTLAYQWSKPLGM